MKIKSILGVCSVIVAIATSSGVWAKNNGQGGGMRSEPSKGQMSRDSGRDTKYRTESRSKNSEYQNNETKERREEHEERRERKDENYRENRPEERTSPELNKQREKKAAQEQNELGRGSEKGQQSREEHSRKWWKLW